MRIFIPLTALIAALAVSSCISERPTSRQVSQTPIWEQTSRYGGAVPRAERYQPADLYSSSGSYRTYTGVNRYGTPNPPEIRSSGQNPNSQQYQENQRRLSGTVTQSAGSSGRYGTGPEAYATGRSEPVGESSPVSGSGSLSPREELSMTGNRQEMLTSAERETGGSSAPASAGDYSNLPFAVPVPGKVGYVQLPSRGANLPEIDVRGIAPGTPVEIPDPASPGSTIQFRVP